MNRWLAFSSLLTLPFAQTAGAVDVTLGSSLRLEMDFGVNKSTSLTLGQSASSVALSLAINGTTDAGLQFGGDVAFIKSDEVQFLPFVETKENGDRLFLMKATVAGSSQLRGAVNMVSGGEAIGPSNIVAVKINSEWSGLEETVTTYLAEVVWRASDICKIAGPAVFDWELNSTFQLTEVDTVLGRQTSQGAIGVLLTLPSSGVLPPGRLLHVAGTLASNSLGVSAYVEGTTTINYFGSNPAAIARIQLAASTAISSNVPNQVLVSRYNVDVADADAGSTEFEVRNASVYAGPFMSVKTVNNEEKLALGAVCVQASTDANFYDARVYMDLADNAVLNRNSAQIFIEGGFGVVSLKSEGATGSVTSIGDMGAKADIADSDLTLHYNALPNFSFSPGLVLNLDDPGEVLAHGTAELAGLTIDYDLLLDVQPLHESAILSGQAWDLGVGYSTDFVTLQFGMDSDWELGLMAEFDLGSWSLYAEAVSPSFQDHELRSYPFLLSATYEADRLAVTGAINQEQRVTLDASYDVAAFSLYGDFDFMSREGRIGTKISF